MLSKILEAYPDEMFLRADGLHSAILGFEHKSRLVVYSVRECIQRLLDLGYDYVDAIEFFEFSVRNVDFGSKTPIFIEDNF
jgi:hypothetical protein